MTCVVCCLLRVVCCVLFAVRQMLVAVRCLLFADCWLLYIVGRLQCVGSSSVRGGGRLLLAVCCLMHDVRCSLCVACRVVIPVCWSPVCVACCWSCVIGCLLLLVCDL